MALGYDREVEDHMLNLSGWQQDGYNLFYYSSVIGHHRSISVLGTPFESSFLLLESDLYDEVGGFDERFDEPGGGFGNIDFFERVAAKPVTYVGLLGEGIFHQVHGGTTTNVSRSMQLEKVDGYRKRYQEIRMRPWRKPKIAPSFYGTVKVRPAVAPQRTGINEDTLQSIRAFLGS
jgi:hypothetical protein